MDVWSPFFNCYSHHSSLILRNGDRADNIIQIREGVMQGDPLAKVSYGIGILLLIKHLKVTHPDVMHPWYAAYAGALGVFDHLEQ